MLSFRSAFAEHTPIFFSYYSLCFFFFFFSCFFFLEFWRLGFYFVRFLYFVRFFFSFVCAQMTLRQSWLERYGRGNEATGRQSNETARQQQPHWLRFNETCLECVMLRLCVLSAFCAFAEICCTSQCCFERRIWYATTSLSLSIFVCVCVRASWNASNQNIVHTIDISAILTLVHARALLESHYQQTITICQHVENSSNVQRLSRAAFKCTESKTNTLNMFILI